MGFYADLLENVPESGLPTTDFLSELELRRFQVPHSMASPFPGMDPYLEAAELWPDFHQQFVAGFYQTLLPGLVDRYRARVQTRQYIHEVVLFTSVITDQHREPFIEIRSRSSGKLMTLVDVVSPGNRLTEVGRNAYLNTRIDAQREGASLVEIDLVLAGTPPFAFDRSSFAESTFVVTVTRPAHPHRHEVYTATLDKHLPRFRLPLAADHQDTLVDLQPIFMRAFDQGNFRERINYTVDPPTTLNEEARAWLQSLLQEQSLR